eukprot:jgi/Astpho2/6027/fgenesh1_pm.00084_%23_13_t
MSDEDYDSEANAAQPRLAIYNTDALHDKLEDISWTTEQPWEETQVILHGDVTEVTNIDDDLSRELAFYTQALGAAQAAIRRFEKAGTKWQRPPDFYAEMVKSDQHMARVKEQLMHEQQNMEQADERRKQREAKRFSKEVQAERRKDKAQQRKAAITDVTKLRKQRQKSGFAGELDLGDVLNQHRPVRKPGERILAGQKGPSKKQQAKDAKFGFGGRKRLQKQNDAVSAASMDLNPRNYRAAGVSKAGARGRGGRRMGAGRGQGGRSMAGGRGGFKGSRGKPQRPGKSRRAAA